MRPVHLVKAIVEKIHDVGGIIVVDKVTCGIGRTGKWIGFMHYGIKTDIIAIYVRDRCKLPIYEDCIIKEVRGIGLMNLYSIN